MSPYCIRLSSKPSSCRTKRKLKSRRTSRLFVYVLPLFHLLNSLFLSVHIPASSSPLLSSGSLSLVPESIPDRRYGIAPNLFPQPAANPPCAMEWVPPAEKAAVCLPVTTRLSPWLRWLTSARPRPFFVAVRRMQILVAVSPLVETARGEYHG